MLETTPFLSNHPSAWSRLVEPTVALLDAHSLAATHATLCVTRRLPRPPSPPHPRRAVDLKASSPTAPLSPCCLRRFSKAARTPRASVAAHHVRPSPVPEPGAPRPSGTGASGSGDTTLRAKYQATAATCGAGGRRAAPTGHWTTDTTVPVRGLHLSGRAPVATASSGQVLLRLAKSLVIGLGPELPLRTDVRPALLCAAPPSKYLPAVGAVVACCTCVVSTALATVPCA